MVTVEGVWLAEEPCIQELYAIAKEHWGVKRASKKGSSDNVDAEYPEVAESANEEVPDMQPSDDFDVAECTAELLLELGAIEAVEKGKAENSPEKPAAENDDYFPDNQLGLEPTFNNSLEDSYGDSVAGLDGVFKGLHLDIDIEIPATQMTPPGDQTPPSEVVVEASKESAEITPTEPEQTPPSVVQVSDDRNLPAAKKAAFVDEKPSSLEAVQAKIRALKCLGPASRF